MRNAAFGYSSVLKEHMGNHTGERPFKCNICDAEFGQSGSVKRRLSTHKKVNGHQVCDATFS